MNKSTFETYIKTKLAEIELLNKMHIEAINNLVQQITSFTLTESDKAPLIDEFNKLVIKDMPQVAKEMHKINKILTPVESNSSDEEKNSSDEEFFNNPHVIEIPKYEPVGLEKARMWNLGNKLKELDEKKEREAKRKLENMSAEKKKYIEEIGGEFKKGKLKVEGKKFKSVEMQAMSSFKMKYYPKYLEVNKNSKLPKKDLYQIYRQRVGDIWRSLSEEEKYIRITEDTENDSYYNNTDWMFVGPEEKYISRNSIQKPKSPNNQ